MSNEAKQLAVAKRSIRRLLDDNHAHFIAKDFMCYPQLNREDDPFADPGETFAQRLRSHIEYCIGDKDCEHEDPKQTIIY